MRSSIFGNAPLASPARARFTNVGSNARGNRASAALNGSPASTASATACSTCAPAPASCCSARFRSAWPSGTPASAITLSWVANWTTSAPRSRGPRPAATAAAGRAAASPAAAMSTGNSPSRRNWAATSATESADTSPPDTTPAALRAR